MLDAGPSHRRAMVWLNRVVARDEPAVVAQVARMVRALRELGYDAGWCDVAPARIEARIATFQWPRKWYAAESDRVRT